MASKKLTELLASNFVLYPIEYRGYLANHLSQGLIALAKIGGSDEKLTTFNDKYVKNHLKNDPAKAIPSQKKINEGNFKDYFGEKKYFLDYVDFYESETSKYGYKKTLSKYLPIFSQSLASAAFHCIIQVGYGLEIESERVISEGLAYLSYADTKFFDSKFDYTDDTNITPFDSNFIFQCLEEIQKCKEIRALCQSSNFESLTFQNRMLKVGNCFSHDLSNKYFGDKVSPKLSTIDFPLSLQEDQLDDAIEQILLSTIMLFYATHSVDFFFLHGITGSRAAKKAYFFLETRLQKAIYIRNLWRSLLAVYVCQGIPKLSKIPSLGNKIENEEERWRKVLETTQNSREEHVLKLVFVCHEENQTFDPKFQFFPKELFLLTCESALENLGLHGQHFNFHGVGYPKL